MKNRVQAEMPKASELPATKSQMSELSDADLQSVSGGLNPQPLPPRQGEPRFM
jgi:bacteriocin-like protein